MPRWSLGDRDDDPRAGQHEVGKVGDGQRRLGAHDAGQQQRQRSKGGAAQQNERHDQEESDRLGAPTEGEAESAQNATWAVSIARTATALPARTSNRRQRSGADAAQHAVPPLEAGLDRQGGEGRGQNGEGKHARDDDAEAVCPCGAPDVDDLGERKNQQQADRQDNGEQQLFAVAHQHGELESSVGQHSAEPGGGSWLWRDVDHGRSSSPVRSRKTSSRVRCSELMLVGATPFSVHQEVT